MKNEKHNGEPTLLVQFLYQMSPLNHKRTTRSLAPPIFCVAKKIGNLKIEGSPLIEGSQNTKSVKMEIQLKS